MNESIVNKIFNEYEELRKKAADERQIRINEIYKKFPRIKEIDDEIYKNGVDNTKKILKDPKNAAKLNKNFKIILNNLEKEKKEIIKNNNIPEDYEDYKYACNLCNDTGYTPDGKKCVCYKQKLINEAYSRSNIGEILQKQNFETFSFKYYSKEKTSEDNYSPYENMNIIYNKCRNFCDNFDNTEKGLLFYGQTGLGKTFLSSCIAKELMDKGKTVIYIRATKLFSLYGDYRFGRVDNKDALDNIYSADLLIIDDLGTEPKNKENFSFLFDVLSERMIENKKLIINTNLNLSELEKIYSKRFTSRIYEFFIPLKFYGSDIRIKKMVEA